VSERSTGCPSTTPRFLVDGSQDDERSEQSEQPVAVEGELHEENRGDHGEDPVRGGERTVELVPSVRASELPR